MNKTQTHIATIYIAGDMHTIETTCRKYCLCGLCVTVTPTNYIFTGGSETGAAIGLINYARFPSEPHVIENHAIALAQQLMSDCCQRSCSVVTPETTLFLENPLIKVSR